MGCRVDHALEPGLQAASGGWRGYPDTRRADLADQRQPGCEGEERAEWRPARPVVLWTVTAVSRRLHSAGGNGEVNTTGRGLNARCRGNRASWLSAGAGYRGKPGGTVTR